MKRAAVIGHPVSHSRSPALFARFAAASGVELDYTAVDVRPEQLEALLTEWRRDEAFVGCNVTLPHKQRALSLADHVEAAAHACGAANVLTRAGNSLVADNTDVEGVEAALATHGVALRGAQVLVLGCGGAARAVAEAARRSGAARIVIAGRNRDRADAVAADFGAEGCGWDDALPLADLYVNATPVGMSGQAQHSVLPLNAPRGAAAFDLVYVPDQTPFLIDARARGLRTVPGAAMFHAQAVATFARWFGFAPKEATV